MCGRVSLISDFKEVEKLFHQQFSEDQIATYLELFPNYNAAPTHFLPALIQDGETKIRFLQWGLIPFWAKDRKIGYKLINARSETAMDKPSFRSAFKKRRCIIAVDGYYEWLRQGKEKVPYRITSDPKEKVFGLCGLWEHWKDPGTGKAADTFTILTMPAAQSVGHIHDRMPFSVEKDHFEVWLTTEFSESEWSEFLVQTARPFSNFYRVSPKVNSVKNNSPELIQKL